MKINKILLIKSIINIFNSEKSIKLLDKYNVLTVKVNIKSNKIEIKNAISEILKLKIYKINIVNVHKKKKIYKNKIGFIKKWKKAYIKLKKDDNKNYLSYIKNIKIN